MPDLNDITTLILAITKLIIALKGTIGLIGKFSHSFRDRRRHGHD
jgi:hypothetical protein